MAGKRFEGGGGVTRMTLPKMEGLTRKQICRLEAGGDRFSLTTAGITARGSRNHFHQNVFWHIQGLACIDLVLRTCPHAASLYLVEPFGRTDIDKRQGSNGQKDIFAVCG